MTARLSTRSRAPFAASGASEPPAGQRRAKAPQSFSPDGPDRFQILLDTTPDGVCVLTRDGVIAEANDAYCAMSGYGRQELMGLPLGQVEAPDSRQQTARQLELLLRDGGHRRFESRHRRRDGSEFDVDVTAFFFEQDGGRIAVFTRDITERKRTEEALRQSELFYRRTLESIPGMSFTTLPDGYCDYQSQQWVEYTGVPMSEHMGDGWSSLLHPDDRPRAYAAWYAAVRGLAPYDLEYRVRRRDGVYEWFKVIGRPILDGRGQVVRWFGTAINIEDVKRAEAGLRCSEARLGLLSRTAGRLLASEEPQLVVNELCRDVMEHLDCQVFFNFLVEPGGDRLRLNACHGVPAQQVGKLEWLDFGAAICGCVAQSGQRMVACDLQHATDARSELVRRLGVQAYGCHPLKAQGRVLGTLSFGTTSRACFRDDELEIMRVVTDQVATAMQRVEAKRALSLANAELLEADRRKNEFLGVLSHELRNPLAPIESSLAVLDQAPVGSPAAQRARQILGRQVSQLSSLVDDLLDVTRVARNKVELDRAPLELGELVSRAVDDHRSLFDKAGVTLRFEGTASSLNVSADRIRLAQIVGNLLQNAARFTPAGGITTVAVSADDGQALVTVTDNGIGMAPQTVGRLFEPFMQAAQELDRSKGGLGLGLALVRGLVELHGGQIAAHSDGLGKGSRFVVRLPLDENAASAEPAPAPAAQPGPHRVLIIEDNVDAADSLRDALELAGHEVCVAHSGPEGLQAARSFAPQAVLCDIGLPGMSGYEVARALRADEALAGVLLIALSGYALPEDLQRAHDAGFERHLAKPAMLGDIERLLADARR